MQLFISWSGYPSRKLADAFRHWIKDVFQNLSPFMSDSDIEAGDLWLNVLQNQLDSSDFGVVFVTKGNLRSEWVHFEAGAIAKAVGRSRLIPILCRVDNVDLSASPLRFFQTKPFDKLGMFAICKSINNALQEKGLNDQHLEKTFQKWWPDLEQSLQTVDFDEEHSGVISDPVRQAVDSLSDRIAQLSDLNLKVVELMIALQRAREQEETWHNQNALRFQPMGSILGTGSGDKPRNVLAEAANFMRSSAERQGPEYAEDD